MERHCYSSILSEPILQGGLNLSQKVRPRVLGVFGRRLLVAWQEAGELGMKTGLAAWSQVLVQFNGETSVSLGLAIASLTRSPPNSFISCEKLFIAYYVHPNKTKPWGCFTIDDNVST